jgi:hypothetical protein
MYSRHRNITLSSTKLTMMSIISHSLLILPALGFGGTTLSPIDTAQQHIRRPTQLYYLDRDPVLEEITFERPKSIPPPAVTVLSDSITTNTTKQSTKKSNAKSTAQLHMKTWNIRYNELLQFKEENGHCLVPQHYPPNPKLGLWVMAQRRYYKLTLDEGKQLSKQHLHRTRILEDIGFVFRVERGPRMAKLDSSSGGTSSINLHSIEDFMEYMIEKDGVYSEEDKRKAWKMRFQIYQ